MEDYLDSTRCARLMKALSEPARLQIVECLLGGPKSVSEVAELLKIDLANASHHLRVMFNAGLVVTEREGKFIYYSIAPDILSERRGAQRNDVLDFGCCRIELPDQKPEA